MPMETVDQHLIVQFSNMMHVRAQQLKARLRPWVKILKMDGDRYAYDGIGQVEARELTGRLNPTQFDNIEHFRRKIARRRFVVTIPMDEMDLEGRLTDPQGEYANAVVAAMERRFDLVCYEAMFADVATGRDFENTISFATDGGLTVNATGGLTLAKLLEINANFIDNEVDVEGNQPVCMGITGDENTTMLQISQLTSGDFSRSYSVEKGRIVEGAGIQFIPFGANANKPVLAVSGGVRTSFAMVKDAIAVGISRDWKITIKDRSDYVDTKQLQITGVMGAVRTEGSRIQKVTTTDL